MGAQGSAERQSAQDEPFVGSTTRVPLLASQVGLVEDLRCGGVQHARAEDFSPDFQVCLPYRGLFVWHVGDDDVVGDANQVLFVSGGEGFGLSQPISAAYAELVITPEPELLAELASASGRSLRFHPLFRQRSRRADFGLQRLRACFLHESIHRNEIAREELMIALLRSSLDGDHHKRALARPTRRLIERTKEFLDANMSSPIRLADIAQAVGASPAYLTDVFRRTEGVPLHRYLTQLRLARALVELPHADDLTTLALALGFSSHSHFTSAFRRAFGRTPSQFRDTARGVPD
jgi:AraC family transcriptional regulator